MALFPAPRIRLHEVLERGKAATTTLDVYQDGVQSIPVSGTFTLLDEAGTAVIGPVAAAVAGGGTVSYSIPAISLPATLAYGDAYLIEWNLTDAAGTVYTFRRPCALAKSRLYPVISDIDLTTHYSDLNSIRPSSLTTWQNYIDEAYIELIHRLRAEGNFEYLIISNQNLRSPHLDYTFYLIWKDMDSSGLGEGRYLQLAELHRKNFESGFKRLKFRYDRDQDGAADDPVGMRAAKAQIFTSAPPTIYYRRW